MGLLDQFTAYVSVGGFPCRYIPAATNTHATAEELLDMSFSVESMLFQKKVWGSFFPELLDLKYFNLQ
jgi:hypothetical protein